MYPIRLGENVKSRKTGGTFGTGGTVSTHRERPLPRAKGVPAFVSPCSPRSLPRTARI